MNVDRVLLAAPRGFCAGVEMAIKALAWMVRSFDAPVYCYHEIVHNKLVVERFEQLGVIFVDDINEVPLGKPIMLSAHGSAPEVVEAARARGSVVVDSVCPLVTKVHHEVKVRSAKGFRIVRAEAPTLSCTWSVMEIPGGCVAVDAEGRRLGRAYAGGSQGIRAADLTALRRTWTDFLPARGWGDLSQETGAI